MLSFTEDEVRLQSAVDALVLASREGWLGRLAPEKADGAAVLDSPVARLLLDAGFRLSSRGLRLRA
jgi:ATP-dependent Lhr-like helicase